MERWLSENGDSTSSSTLSSTSKTVVHEENETMIYRVGPNDEYLKELLSNMIFPSVHTPVGVPRGNSVTASSDTSKPCRRAIRRELRPVPPTVMIRGDSSPGTY